MYRTMFAHNVIAYIATSKWRVLQVTLQVAAPGAESAVWSAKDRCNVGLPSMHAVSPELDSIALYRSVLSTLMSADDELHVSSITLA